MTVEALGRIILIKTPYIDNSGVVIEIWYVAIDDDSSAIEEVRKLSNSSSDTPIEVVGKISSKLLSALDIPLGGARSAV